MASSDPVIVVEAVMPPLTSGALFGPRTGGSTPAEQIPYYAFDAAADNYLDYYCHLLGYGGGGLTIWLDWIAATATTGGVLWACAIRRSQVATEDLDIAHTYDYNEVRSVCAATNGQVSRATITFTSGTDMDSLANQEFFILRVRRRGSDNTASTGDDMAGAAQLIGLTGLES